MTDDKKHDDKDREMVSDEELEDVAGGGGNVVKTKTILGSLGGNLGSVPHPRDLASYAPPEDTGRLYSRSGCRQDLH